MGSDMTSTSLSFTAVCAGTEVLFANRARL